MTRRAMRVYCAGFWTRDDGLLLSWHTSERAARSALAAMRRQHGAPVGPCEVTPHEIPRTLVGMVDWLNRNFQSDNG